MESNQTIQKTWIKIYPSYIDKDLKQSEGRKVSALYAVDKPTVPEIYVICRDIFGLECNVEKHHHPKDWMKRGRVIVHLKNGNKSVLTNINSSIHYLSRKYITEKNSRYY